MQKNEREIKVKSFNLLCGEEILDYKDKLDEALLTDNLIKICTQYFKKVVLYDSQNIEK